MFDAAAADLQKHMTRPGEVINRVARAFETVCVKLCQLIVRRVSAGHINSTWIDCMPSI